MILRGLFFPPPNNYIMTTLGTKIIISGCGNVNANGIYTHSSDFNGYPLYVKDRHYTIAFYPTFMPYATGPGYYIMYDSFLQLSIKNDKPLFRKEGTDPMTTDKVWVSCLGMSSGEDISGTIIIDYPSSSSSSSSYVEPS